MVDPTPRPIKFFCSYGGRILPRYPDGMLRYHGGHTRVLSVDCSITVAELLVRMGEMCGSSVSLRCQLPADDLDALVSVTSDEDLANLIEEYGQSPPQSALKIRAFFYAPKTVKKASPPPSAAAPLKPTFYPCGGGAPPRCRTSNARRLLSRPPECYTGVGAAGKGRPELGGYQYRDWWLCSSRPLLPLPIAKKSLAQAKY